MTIPTTRKEFITEILKDIGTPNIDSNKYTIDLFSSIKDEVGFSLWGYSYLKKLKDKEYINNKIFEFLNQEIKPYREKIRVKLLSYGVNNPYIPALKINEDLSDFLSRIWIYNAETILSNCLLNRKNWLSEIPYQERKFLMVVDDLKSYKNATPNIIQFQTKQFPSILKFEGGSPISGEFYIAHPYRAGVYLPVSKYEHLLFRERIHELSKVMMALGATEIRTIQNKGYSSQSESQRSSKTSASGSYEGKFSASGSYASDSTHANETESDEAIIINFKNDPLQKPYIPDGLVWYPYEREWQQIADNRLNGNLLEYEIKISSKEINLVSSAERSNIEAQVNVLLASASFTRETASRSIFKEESAKSTSILIKFKSRKDY